jgi:tetratricopeptide (TPR) repeat protein
MKKATNGFPYFLILAVGIFCLAGCEIGDGLRNWGTRHRQKRAQQISAADLEMFRRDLALSEAKALELHEHIQSLVTERKLQGHLAWKIARELMKESRFEAASDYYRAAVNGEMPEAGQQLTDTVNFEQALPYFQKALKYHVPDPDLLFDAGLCYANASRALGWEEDRFQTAVFLFERGMALKPTDGRFLYQLALLYGKAENRYRNPERAIELLDVLLKREDANIPARFARANILAENGDLQGAFDENLRITEKIKFLFESNSVRGDYRKNAQYQAAQENMKQLQRCIEGRSDCTLKPGPEMKSK